MKTRYIAIIIILVIFLGPVTSINTLSEEDTEIDGSSTVQRRQESDLRYSLSTNISNVDASFVGQNPHDQLGFSVDSAGDVNGDGYDDIIIGEPRSNKVYLVFGMPKGWKMDTDITRANVTFIGEGWGDHSGYSVAGVGDVNGDGYDDILIGAPFNDEYAPDGGQSYLIFGRSGNWSNTISLSNSNASFFGDGGNHYLGYTVGGGGDVNGDGYSDFLLGSPDKSLVALFYGQESGWEMHTTLGKLKFYDEKGDYCGYSFSNNGDVNGDGFDDIIIGCYFHNQDMGKAYLFFGESSKMQEKKNISNADASFIGENIYDRAGHSVSIVGDINNDGYDDIIIGAYGHKEMENAGQSYIIFGKSSNWKKDMKLSEADASIVGTAGDKSGTVSSAGDVNGDGYADFLIGSPQNSDGGDRNGQTYLFLGKSDNWDLGANISSADASFIGEDILDFCGYKQAGAGDINGDGFDDIIIGVFGNNHTVNTSTQYDDGLGQVYLIFSKTGKKNTPPVVMSILDQDQAYDENFTYKVEADDLEGDKLTYTLLESPLGMVIDNDGLISYKPSLADVGSKFLVSVSVSDNQTNSFVHFTLTISEPSFPVTIGPIKSDNDKPMDGLDIELSDGDTIIHGKTDSDGYAIVDIPKSWAGKKINITATNNKKEKIEFVGTVQEGGGFSPSGGSYPTFEHDVKTSDNNEWITLVVLLLIVIIIISILALMLIRKTPREEDIELDHTDDKWKEMDQSEE